MITNRNYSCLSTCFPSENIAEWSSAQHQQGQIDQIMIETSHVVSARRITLFCRQNDVSCHSRPGLTNSAANDASSVDGFLFF